MKKPVLWGLGILIVLAIVGFTAGPWIYREFIAGEADAELTLPGQTEAATTDVNGTWTVVPGPDDDAKRTQAGYRVDEILRGSPLTVNGRTPKVTGEAVVAAEKLESATFTVDVASITSPESARDNQFRGEDILDTGKFPTAELRVTQPVDIAAVPETGAPVTLDVPVSLTVKGVARDVTAKVDVQRAGDTIVAAGSVPVTWTDFNVTPPDFAGFVTVEPTGTIEFLVNLAKQ
ncbi:YceI family protein [Mycolicibacterium gadium]|uniref:YceI family protein n=2 Tax=Mycolicibacterium gadium TaxID=1794 RepID=A0ABT6GR49_MYCGU|nr:YceI family protein [Mycolicibacterium gadium]MDG5483753.1 YceI family protein [Mycolicibacterium gadium]